MFMLLAIALAAPLTPEMQQEDFRVAWEALDRMHPSLHLYTSEEELQRRREAGRRRLDRPRSPEAFWPVLMDSVGAIGCGHTVVQPSLERLVPLVRTASFPFDLVVVDDRLFLDPRQHPEGGEVLSIQGQPADEVLGRLRSLTNSDGRSTPLQDHRIDQRAPWLVPHLFDVPDHYDVVLERNGERLAQTVAAKGRVDTAVGSDPSPETDDDRYEAWAVGPDLARARPTASALASQPLLLVMDGFDKGSVRRRILPALRRAARAHAPAVIIDLRRNMGGSPWPALEVFGHLVQAPERVYDQRLVRWPAYAEQLAGADHGPRYDYLTSPSFTEDQAIADGWWDRGYGEEGTVVPAEPRFAGEVFVLTSGATFSTAADLAALVQRNGRGRLVGDTAGGSATLQTSGRTVEVTLTHSRIELSIPLSRARLVDDDGHFAGQVGAEPDVPVQPTMDELRRGDDAVLRAALDLVFDHARR